MEIEIPVADHDTGTESQPTGRSFPGGTEEGQPTDRSFPQTQSDGWSREGQASTLTSRSLAPSGVFSQPPGAKSHVTESEASVDVDMKSQPESGRWSALAADYDAEDGDSTGRTSSERAAGGHTVSRDSVRLDSLKSPKTERSLAPEDSHRSTRLAAEQATDRYLSALGGSDSPGGEEGKESVVMETARDAAAGDSRMEPSPDAVEGEWGMDSTRVEVDPTDVETVSEREAFTGKLVDDKPKHRGTVGDHTSSEWNTTLKQEADAVGDHTSSEPNTTKKEEADTVGDPYSSEANTEEKALAVNSNQETPQNSEDSTDPEDTNKDHDAETGTRRSDHNTVDHTPTSDPAADTEDDTDKPRNPPDDEPTPRSEKPSRHHDNDTQDGGGVFLTENINGDAAQDDGSDISDARAETPDWQEEEEEGEEVEGGDVASLSDIAGLRTGRASAMSRLRPLTGSTVDEDVAPGQRAVVNTPVSCINTDYNTEPARNTESRNTSRVGLETAREAAFQRAMTLMTNRCERDTEGEPWEGLYEGGPPEATFGPKHPQYFFVKQKKPVNNMAPLKAWRGYHGNVYFEPMNIQKVGKGEGGGVRALSHKPPASVASCKSAGSRRTRATTPASRSRALVLVDPEERDSVMTAGDSSQALTRSPSRLTLKRGPTSAKSGASGRSVAAITQHHVLYLDRTAVTRHDNAAMHEELQVMEKQAATGSLNVTTRGSHYSQSRRGPTAAARRSGAQSAKTDRICRGSVAHRLRRAQSGGTLGNSMSRAAPGATGQQQQPHEKKQQQQQLQQREQQQRKSLRSQGSTRHGTVKGGGGGGGGGCSQDLMVIGDKFAAPSHMSPLLRTQTQFSLSSQRVTMNSPDLYSGFERLPPLEQVRISLRHLDAAHGDSTPYASRTPTPFNVSVPGVGGGGGGGGVVVEDLKPFIKYSPDVRARYNQQLKFF